MAAAPGLPLLDGLVRQLVIHKNVTDPDEGEPVQHTGPMLVRDMIVHRRAPFISLTKIKQIACDTDVTRRQHGDLCAAEHRVLSPDSKMCAVSRAVTRIPLCAVT